MVHAASGMCLHARTYSCLSGQLIEVGWPAAGLDGTHGYAPRPRVLHMEMTYLKDKRT